MAAQYYIGASFYGDELQHYGILGQKWGIRRFQNPDGTLTPAGKARYGTDAEKLAAKDAQRVNDAKIAYGEGAGTRRKLLDKEIKEKMKNKEYAKAYEEASKHVSVEKSLKKAESLNRHSGSFVRGRDLNDRGMTASKRILKTFGEVAGNALITGGVAYYTYKTTGMRFASDLMLAVGAYNAGKSIYKGGRDVYSLAYYKKNKKF